MQLITPCQIDLSAKNGALVNQVKVIGGLRELTYTEFMVQSLHMTNRTEQLPAGVDAIWFQETEFSSEGSKFQRTIDSGDPGAIELGYAKLEELTTWDFQFGSDEGRLIKRYGHMIFLADLGRRALEERKDGVRAELFKARRDELLDVLNALSKPLAGMRQRVRQRKQDSA